MENLWDGVPPDQQLLLARAAREWLASGSARVVREAAGLSRREVGDALGIRADTLARWERGASRPSIARAAHYALILRALMRPAYTLEKQTGIPLLEFDFLSDPPFHLDD